MANIAAIRIYDNPNQTMIEIYGTVTHHQLRRVFLAEIGAREAIGLSFDSPELVRWAAQIMAAHGNRKRKHNAL